ncbi:hypothetical protein ACHWQZ_G019144 [Mnemiopsis leidyi]
MSIKDSLLECEYLKYPIQSREEFNYEDKNGSYMDYPTLQDCNTYNTPYTQQQHDSDTSTHKSHSDSSNSSEQSYCDLDRSTSSVEGADRNLNLSTLSESNLALSGSGRSRKRLTAEEKREKHRLDQQQRRNNELPWEKAKRLQRGAERQRLKRMNYTEAEKQRAKELAKKRTKERRARETEEEREIRRIRDRMRMREKRALIKQVRVLGAEAVAQTCVRLLNPPSTNTSQLVSTPNSTSNTETTVDLSNIVLPPDNSLSDPASCNPVFSQLPPLRPAYQNFTPQNNPGPSDLRMTPGDLRMKPGDLQMTPGDLRMKPGDIQMTPGDQQMTHSDLQISPGDLQISLGDIELPSGDIQLPSGDLQINPGDIKLSAGDIKLSPGDIKLPPLNLQRTSIDLQPLFPSNLLQQAPKSYSSSDSAGGGNPSSTNALYAVAKDYLAAEHEKYLKQKERQRIRCKEKRANESPEERAIRLRKAAERQRLKRMSLTEPQKMLYNEINRMRARKRRSAESAQQQDKRRSSERVRRREQRALSRHVQETSVVRPSFVAELNQGEEQNNRLAPSEFTESEFILL